MRIQLELSDRFYAIAGRIATSLEAIALTLEGPPEDFSKEDAQVKTAAEQVQEALNKLP